jgi:hypothetical protein
MENMEYSEQLILLQREEIQKLRDSNNELGKIVGMLREKLIVAQSKIDKTKRVDDIYLQRRLIEELWKDGETKPMQSLRSMDSLSYSLFGENRRNLDLVKQFIKSNELAFLKKGRAGWTALEPKAKALSVFDRKNNIIQEKENEK